MTTSMRSHGIALCLIGLTVLAGCAHAQIAAPQPRVVGRSLAGDTALFATIVRSLPRAEHHDLMIDPRVIKDDPSIVYVHPATDFVEVDGADVEARATVIQRLHARRLSGSDNRACDQGPGGLEKVPDSATLARITSNPRRPLCVIMGIPRPGGPYFPPREIDRRSSVPAGAYTVRTVTIDPGKYTVYDVVCAPGGAGWTVLEKVVLYEGWS